MTFDTRARQASQGIRRAVEVMEMSGTKTPQRLTRYDEFRQRRSRNQRIAAYVVAIGVPLLLLGALYLVMRDPGGAQVLTPPSPSATASETAAPVEAGSETFDPAFTYTLPATWEVTSDSPRNFTLSTSAAPGGLVLLLRDVVAAAYDCSSRPNPDVGTSSEAITDWMSVNPDLEATSPQRVTIGGTTGYRVDVQQAEQGGACGGGSVRLVTGKPDGQPAWDVGPGVRMRVFVLDMSDGGTVTIISQSFADDFAGFIDEAMPVVDSIEFSA